MITIDDPETERLARELAARSGRSVEAEVTAAVHAAVRAYRRGAEAMPRAEVPPDEQARRHAALVEIARRMDALPDLDARSAEEILGYDEHGLPT